MKSGYWGTLCALLCSLSLRANALPEASADIRHDATVMAVEQVMPSVVNIATETVVEYHDFYDDLLREFYGWRRTPRKERYISLGSGVIIDEDGDVLTNLHVVQRATRVQVKLGAGSVKSIQILSGLNVGDQVILTDMSTWDSFDRVRLK